MPDKILVTGAAGFIGRARVSALRERGHTVVAAARQKPAGDLPPEVLWAACDLTDRGAVEAMLATHRPKGLVHLAWHMAPGNTVAVQNYDWIAHSIGLLRAFAAEGGQRALLCGSCMEYDWRLPGPYAEDTAPLTSPFPYGHAKAGLFRIFQDFCATQGLSGAWARPFFMYGPGESERRLAADVALSLLKGEDARCSDGWQKRDFMHVADVAGAMAALYDSGCEGPVNIATGQTVELRSFITEIARQIGREDLVRFGARPTPPNEAAEIAADVTRLTRDIGFHPEFTLETGIADTIASWQRHISKMVVPSCAKQIPKF